MIASTPADQLKRLRKRLDWAANLLLLQPPPLRTAYHEAGRAIAGALIAPVFSFRVLLPSHILVDSTVRPVP